MEDNTLYIWSLPLCKYREVKTLEIWRTTHYISDHYLYVSTGRSIHWRYGGQHIIYLITTWPPCTYIEVVIRYLMCCPPYLQCVVLHISNVLTPLYLHRGSDQISNVLSSIPPMYLLPSICLLWGSDQMSNNISSYLHRGSVQMSNNISSYLHRGSVQMSNNISSYLHRGSDQMSNNISSYLHRGSVQMSNNISSYLHRGSDQMSNNISSYLHRGSDQMSNHISSYLHRAGGYIIRHLITTSV
jgi:hypothetical protein